jgi:hypothetical protein
LIYDINLGFGIRYKSRFIYTAYQTLDLYRIQNPRFLLHSKIDLYRVPQPRYIPHTTTYLGFDIRYESMFWYNI